jgi:hypothetical protein
VEQVQERGAASRSESLRAQVRGWFTSSGAPPAWGLVGYMVCGLVNGSGPHGSLARLQRDASGALAGVIVAAAGSAGPSGSLAAVRVGTTLFGVVVLAFASLVVPDRVLFSFGVVVLFTGVGLSPPYPIVAGALTTIGSVLFAGAPTGDATSWAGHRLLDTLVGCAVALTATYLLWPRDRESESAAVPAPTT